MIVYLKIEISSGCCLYIYVSFLSLLSSLKFIVVNSVNKIYKKSKRFIVINVYIVILSFYCLVYWNGFTQKKIIGVDRFLDFLFYGYGFMYKYLKKPFAINLKEMPPNYIFIILYMFLYKNYFTVCKILRRNQWHIFLFEYLFLLFYNLFYWFSCHISKFNDIIYSLLIVYS